MTIPELVQDPYTLRTLLRKLSDDDMIKLYTQVKAEADHRMDKMFGPKEKKII